MAVAARGATRVCSRAKREIEAFLIEAAALETLCIE